MKKLYYIFLLLAGFAGCRDNADYPFLGNDAVYFQLSATWTNTQDSLIYSFAGKGVDEDTLWVKVNLEGNMTAKARPVKVIVNEEKTTAEVGLHYEALQEEYELPGNSVYTRIPVIIYNTDKTLENRSVTIALALQASETLDLGITERLEVRLIVSNTLKKPDYWETTIHYDFGSYSRKKHEVCIEQLRLDFPETRDGYNAEGNKWGVYGLYMSNYFEENIVNDENNVRIEPW